MTKESERDKPESGKKGMRSTPTERMLNMARAASQRLQIDLPGNVETDFDACKAFLDAHAASMPPTENQIAFAKRVAEQTGVDLPAETLENWKAMRVWLDKHAPRQ